MKRLRVNRLCVDFLTFIVCKWSANGLQVDCSSSAIPSECGASVNNKLFLGDFWIQIQARIVRDKDMMSSDECDWSSRQCHCLSHLNSLKIRNFLWLM